MYYIGTKSTCLYRLQCFMIIIFLIYISDWIHISTINIIKFDFFFFFFSSSPYFFFKYFPSSIIEITSMFIILLQNAASKSLWIEMTDFFENESVSIYTYCPQSISFLLNVSLFIFDLQVFFSLLYK